MLGRVFIGLFVSASSAQFVEPDARVIHATSGAGNYGWAVADLADINGDGAMEAITSAPNSNAAIVLDGRTGDVIWTLATTSGSNGFAVSDAGLVDDDDVHDIVSGAPAGGAGRIHVWSGATGELIMTVEGEVAGDRFGGAVGGIGDVNGDGRDDLIVGAERHDGAGSGAGRSYIVSGMDGSFLSWFDGEEAGDLCGSGVAGTRGDVDGDGVPDAIVGARGAGANGGRAYVISGADASPILPTLEPDPGPGSFGQYFVAGVGDVNADGWIDVFAGDYGASRSYVFSGRDGSRIHVLRGSGGLGCGRGAGDVNHDGYADLAIGSWVNPEGAPAAGKVTIFDGRTGCVLRDITCDIRGHNFGYDAVGIGDVDADGEIDFLVGAAGGSMTYVIAGNTPPCPADLTRDGVFDIFDVLMFLGEFDASSACGDWNGDGVHDIFDVLAFLGETC